MRRRERAVIFILAALLAAAFLRRLYTRGGPYFDRPATVMEHVGPGKHETRDALVLVPKIRPLLPHGAEVTCFRPYYGNPPEEDTPNFFTAVGLLPNQIVVPPFTAGPKVKLPDLVEYVIAVRDAYTNPAYKVVAEFPEGRLYKVQR